MNEFTKQVKAKGWAMKEVAQRWGVTPRRMSQIAADPKKKDWDALRGLPEHQDTLKAGCGGTRDYWGEYDCNYGTTITCDECKYGAGQKDPAAKCNQL